MNAGTSTSCFRVPKIVFEEAGNVTLWLHLAILFEGGSLVRSNHQQELWRKLWQSSFNPVSTEVDRVPYALILRDSALISIHPPEVTMRLFCGEIQRLDSTMTYA